MITLPFPPSVNRIWRSVNGRTLVSSAYRRWKGAALAELMIQRPRPIDGPYRMTIVATRPDNRARDLDNIAKPISDALVTAGVIRDDSDARSILLQWSEAAPDKTAGVRIVLETA